MCAYSKGWVTILLVSAVVIAGCAAPAGHLKVDFPYRTEELALFPVGEDVIITVAGCAIAENSELQVQLMPRSGDSELDLSDRFTFEDGQWIARKLIVPLGIHVLTAEANLIPNPNCTGPGPIQDTTSVTLYAYVPSCLEGYAMAHLNLKSSQPYPFAPITVGFELTDGDETWNPYVWHATANEGGYYCVDHVPLDEALTVIIFDTGTGLNETCRAEMTGTAGRLGGTCTIGDCTVLPTIDALCTAD